MGTFAATGSERGGIHFGRWRAVPPFGGAKEPVGPVIRAAASALARSGHHHIVPLNAYPRASPQAKAFLISKDTKRRARRVFSLPFKGKGPFHHRLRFIGNQESL